MANRSHGAARASQWVATLVALGCLCGLAPALATEKYSEAAVKAAFIHRFASYVEWPAATASSSRLTIAVMGDTEVATQLEALVARQSAGRSTQVVRASRAADLRTAQIVYIGAGLHRDLRYLVSAVENKPVLVVAEDEHGLDYGAAINFLVVDHRVRFEVSLTATQRAGLRISSDMLSVATRVLGTQRSEPRVGDAKQ